MCAVPSSTASSDAIQLRERDLGQEAEAAEVHAEDRDVDARLGDAAGHAEERAVAAEHDDQVAFVRQVVARDGRPSRRQAGERGGLGLEHRRDVARLEPAGELREHARRPHRGRCFATRPTRVIGMQTRPALIEPGAGEAGTRGCLPSPAIGDRSCPARSNPSASAAAATSSTTRALHGRRRARCRPCRLRRGRLRTAA